MSITEPTAGKKRSIESALWKENLLLDNHVAVWGSWYDTSEKKWGFSCCKALKRDIQCTLPPVPKPEEPKMKIPKVGKHDSDSGTDGAGDSSPDSCREEDLKEDIPLSWKDPPAEMQMPEAVGSGNPREFLEHFIFCVFGEWERELEKGLIGFKDMERQAFANSLEEAKKAITPLVWRMRRKQNLNRGEEKDTRVSRETRTSMEGKFVKEKSVLESLNVMATAAALKEYKRSHEMYMQLAFGNKMWNSTHVAHVAACTMKGAREYRRNRDSLNTYDMDPVSQKYMQALKKLCYFVQIMRPNDDTSKNVVI